MSSAEPGSVVVGIDQEAKGYQKALEFAALEANRRGTGIRLVHGCEPLAAFGELDPIPSIAEREHEQRALRILEAAAEALRPALDPGGQVECRVWRRTGADALVEESKQAAIVVLQHRKLSHIRRFSTTSTTSRVAAQAECPVAVVRQEHILDAGHSGVAVGVDIPGHAQLALDVAFTEAALRKTSLTAVHAWIWSNVSPTYGYVVPTEEQVEAARERAQVNIAEAMHGYAERYPEVVVKQLAVQGSVDDALQQASERAELLVVGRHGSQHVGSLALGGVARHCINSAACPVIVTPSGRVGRHWPSLKREKHSSH